MDKDTLRARQNPLKERYRDEPSAAKVRMMSAGDLDPSSLQCHVRTFGGQVRSGLHAAAGGTGEDACSGDMLLDALVACAGVTVCAVATALGIELRGGRVRAAATLDFRGTLAVSRDTPIGLQEIELVFELDTDAGDEELDKLLSLTERYCVIFQTLKTPPALSSRRERASSTG